MGLDKHSGLKTIHHGKTSQETPVNLTASDNEVDSQFRRIFEHAAIGIAMVAPDGSWLTVNDKLCEIIGYTKEELLTKTFQEITHPDDLDTDLQYADKMLSGEVETYTRHKRYFHKLGHIVWINLSVNLVRDASNNPDYFISFIEDISDRKEAEEALLESEKKYRTLFEKSADAILIIEGDHFVDCNTATVEMLGYSNKKELLDTHPSQLSPETQPDGKSSFIKANEMIEIAFRDGSHRFEWDHVRQNGEVFPVEVLLTAVPYRGKSFLHVVWRDITERKRLEELESRAARLDTAGTIAGQVAHDFNNLLAPLMAYPEIIRESLSDGHSSIVYLEHIEKAANKIAEINQQLLTLGRRGHYNQTVINLNSIIEQVVNEMQPKEKEISFSLDLEPEVMNILGGNSQLYRVVNNLITNAIDAIQSKGKIKIRTENYYADDVSSAFGRVPKGEFVKLTISDTGCGIPDNIVQKILDPFFTTKTTDKIRGSGLGLSVVNAVVKDHNGYLDLQTCSGEGSSFYIYFPITRKSADANTNNDISCGTESILVVDDDSMQREVTNQLLIRLGYSVHSVKSGEEAITYLEDNDCDLLILDMVMPGGIDGAETFKRIHEVNPNQKAIIVSGFSESSRVRLAQGLGAGAFVKKPLTKKTIAAAVRAELDKKETTNV